MKKFFMSMALLATMAFVFNSCSKDDGTDDAVDTSPISLYSGEDKVVQGADTITTSNKFVAYATKNTIHGWHVGQATLQVNGKKTISVTVLPQYYLYDDPVLDWGCTIDQVKKNQKQGTINSKSTSEMLAYENAGGASLIGYTFKNGGLESVLAMVSTNHTSRLGGYLAERFLVLPLYEGKDVNFAGMDATELEKANTVVFMELYNTDYWVVYYKQSSQNSTRLGGMDNNEINEFVQLLMAE